MDIKTQNAATAGREEGASKRARRKRLRGAECRPREAVLALTSDEREVLRRLGELDTLHGRHARALLELAGGVTQQVAAERAGLSTRRVRYWLAAFRERQMAIFPARVLQELGHTEASLSPAEASQRPVGDVDPRSSGLQSVLPDDTMAEAARKTLERHFLEMLKHEEGTRAGLDIEELHQMRVACRRMRAAFRVYQDALDTKRLAPVVRGVRATAAALGRVRDLDVFHEKTERYLKPVKGRDALDLTPLLEAWESAHTTARVSMLEHLDSAEYAKFVAHTTSLLREPFPEGRVLTAEQIAVPRRVRHVAPVVIYRRLADVRAYDEWLSEPAAPLERYHSLRIAAKYLRYTLEFLSEVIGPEGAEAIALLKQLQDHLGDLQDAVVASSRLRNFLTWGTWEPPDSSKALRVSAMPIVAPDVARYLALRQTEIRSLIEGFPIVWQRFVSSEFTHLIARAVSAL